MRGESGEIKGSDPMIGVPGQNGRGPVKLFEHQGPHHLVRQGKLAERQHQPRRGAERGRQPVRPADHKGNGGCAVLPEVAELLGKFEAGHRFSALIESDERCPFRNRREDGLGLVGHPVIRAPLGAFCEFDCSEFLNADRTQRGLKPRCVSFAELALGACLEAAHGDQQNLQEIFASATLPRFGWPVIAPEPLDIVETARVGLESVHDDIACINQHPLAGAHAFDLRRAEAAVFQRLHNPFGDRTDMPIRSSGRDHHVIGERRFSGKIDGQDILGLGVVQRRQNDPEG